MNKCTETVHHQRAQTFSTIHRNARSWSPLGGHVHGDLEHFIRGGDGAVDTPGVNPYIELYLGKPGDDLDPAFCSSSATARGPFRTRSWTNGPRAYLDKNATTISRKGPRRELFRFDMGERSLAQLSTEFLTLRLFDDCHFYEEPQETRTSRTLPEAPPHSTSAHRGPQRQDETKLSGEWERFPCRRSCVSLSDACFAGDTERARELLQAGADPNEDGSDGARVKRPIQDINLCSLPRGAVT